MLMIFEDAHWTDPTSLEALRRSVDKIKALSALLIVTFRPEFERLGRAVSSDQHHTQSSWGA